MFMWGYSLLSVTLITLLLSMINFTLHIVSYYIVGICTSIVDSYLVDDPLFLAHMHSVDTLFVIGPARMALKCIYLQTVKYFGCCIRYLLSVCYKTLLIKVFINGIRFVSMAYTDH